MKIKIKSTRPNSNLLMRLMVTTSPMTRMTIFKTAIKTTVVLVRTDARVKVGVGRMVRLRTSADRIARSRTKVDIEILMKEVEEVVEEVATLGLIAEACLEEETQETDRMDIRILEM
jgi:peptide subunit release factor 1 (eRF1)